MLYTEKQQKSQPSQLHITIQNISRPVFFLYTGL